MRQERRQSIVQEPLEIVEINGESFKVNLMLAPIVVAGAWFGRKLVLKIDQRTFENIALALSFRWKPEKVIS